MTRAALPVDRLGAYRLIRVLGTGGMGTVYLAHDEEHDRRVALKVIHPHLLGRQGALRRLRREALAGERIRHPNVVRAIEAGVEEVDGRPWHFLVTEHVAGKSLRALLDESGAVPERDVREIGRQIAAGLAAIHREGMIHRDIKPENVLVTPDGCARITDLGVVRSRSADPRSSDEGRFAGTLLYAPPEQLLGKSLRPSADLYSLGETLYELATGSHPSGDRRSCPDVERLLHPHVVPADRVNPELSPFLTTLLAELLQPDPDLRPESAELVERILAEGEAGAWWRARAGTSAT